MEKKRIFISIHYMELGGAEISLIGLLQAIDYSHYDIDLFIHSHRGELLNYIPKEVNLLPEIVEYTQIECPMMDTLMNGFWGILFGRLKAKWLHHKFLKNRDKNESAAGLQYVAKCISPFLPSLYKFGKYDLAISFLTPHNYVLDKVLAKKKICWIHTDYTKVIINVDEEFPTWSAYDNIISISPDVTKSFLQIFPTLKHKIIEIGNILSPNFVRNRAEEFDAHMELKSRKKDINYITILSIGRFSYPKNFDNIPDICRRINSMIKIQNSKLKVHWFLIGYGSDEQLIRYSIHEADMEDDVIILGKKSNPYPYIKACDIYVQPSRYEGNSVTVREAQMLYKPVVVTDYPTAKSQIQNGLDGLIVPMDNEGCAHGIADFIANISLREKIKKYLKTHDYGNVMEIEKLYQLI